MSGSPLFQPKVPPKAQAGLAILWLAVSAAVAWVAGIPYGLFLAWAGIATGVFVLDPFAGTLGLVILNVIAADWGQAFVLFPDKPYNINQAGLANLVMAGLAALYVVRRRPRRAALTLPFAAFLAAGLISIPFSSSPFAGLRDWTRMIPLAGLYVIAADLFRKAPDRARVWIVAVVASSVWPAIVSIHQGLTYTGHHSRWGAAGPGQNRLLGTLGHPIFYGVYLCAIIALAIYLFRSTDRKRPHAAFGLLVIGSLALLFFSYSRGPALAAVVSLIALAILARREPQRWRAGLIGLAVLFFAIVLLASRVQDLFEPSLYRLMEPVPTEQADTPLATQTPPAAEPTQTGQDTSEDFLTRDQNSLSWRLNLWRFAVMLALERPLVGLGLGGFSQQSPRLVGWSVTPHNDFVRVFAETGILGLVAFLWLWNALASRLWRFWRDASDHGQSLLAATLLAVAVGYLINCLTADMLNNPTAGWVFWPLMALPEAFAPRAETRG